MAKPSKRTKKLAKKGTLGKQIQQRRQHQGVTRKRARQVEARRAAKPSAGKGAAAGEGVGKTQAPDDAPVDVEGMDVDEFMEFMEASGDENDGVAESDAALRKAVVAEEGVDGDAAEAADAMEEEDDDEAEDAAPEVKQIEERTASKTASLAQCVSPPGRDPRPVTRRNRVSVGPFGTMHGGARGCIAHTLTLACRCGADTARSWRR